MTLNLDLERLRALVASGHDPSACPSADLLGAVAAGQADARDRRAAADHLAGCTSCTEEYRAAVALGPWARAASDGPGFAVQGARPARIWRTPPLTAAAAALFAVAVGLGLAGWALALRADNARLAAMLSARNGADTPLAAGTDPQRIATLERRLADASAPTMNSSIVDLLPVDRVRGIGSAPLPRVAAAAGFVTFVITPPADPADREHELEILDARGAVRWRGGGLRPNPERTFTVTMPTALLPAGRCRVRLYERRNGEPRLVADYAFDVHQ